MTTPKNTMICLTAAALLSLTALGRAQNMSASGTFSKSYGDSDAGVYVYANTYVSAGLSKNYIASSGTGWTIVPYWQTTMAASGSGRVLADLKFLGSSKRAGEFKMYLVAAGVVYQSTLGVVTGTTCTSNGSVYLKVAGSVVWNTAFTTSFTGRSTLRLSLMAPTLVVPLGGGLAVLNGQAYARVRAAMDGTFDPCAGQVRLNGEAAVSGDGSASATVISLLLFANATVSFYAQEQKIRANSLTAQPGIGMPYTWGRAGNLLFISGAMRGLVELNAMLPPFIPISTTLADWSKPLTYTQLL